jgi:peptide/nickel transport system substrate-binding protein
MDHERIWGDRLTHTDAASPSSREGEGAEIRTFLIADVRGYTLFTQERGDEAAAKLARKFATIAREGVDARGGEVIELRGDEALAVFASPRQAIRAAVDLQERFAEETVDDPSLPLPVGIGLDAGEAVRVEGGYRGGALNLAARLCGQAGAGEILASQEVVHLARKVDGVRYQDRGDLHLKGLSAPVHALRVLPQDGDPASIVGPYAPVRPAPSPPHRRRSFPRSLVSSRPRLVATIVVLALVATGIPLALARFGGPAPSVEIGENAVGWLDAESGRVLGTIETGTMPGAMAFGEGAVWVANSGGTVSRIDPQEEQVIQTIQVPQDPAGIAVGERAVWVTSAREGTVTRINPKTNTVVGDPIEVGNGPAGIAVGDHEVWVADKLDDTVVRIDPGTDEVSLPIAVGGSPSGISYGDGAAWVTNETEATVSRIDADTGTVTQTIPVGNGPGNVVAAEGAVWVANRLDGTVSKIDPTTNHVAALLQTGEGAGGIAVAPDGVWVASELGGSVTRFDPDGTKGSTFALEVAVLDLALVDGTVWFTSRGSPTDHRGGTLKLVSAVPPDSIDPALGLPFPLVSLVGDGLIGFKRVGGVDGSTLIPDLAISIPRPDDSGTIYSFRLRAGIRYSDGRPVRASDIRRAIERAFRVAAPDASGFQHVDGADACLATPASCDLSEGIQVDDEQGAITFHLTAPDPDFLYSLTVPGSYPVPPGTPDEDVGVHPVPATGPYKITRYVPGKLMELERNTYFEQWTGNRPDGFVDRIVVRIVAPEDMADEVMAGRADYVVNPPLIPPDDLHRVTTQFTEQVHTYTRAGTFGFFLNTQLAPFDDVGVRKALNFAVDRQRVLELFPFPGSKITCQILPPGTAGYRPYCPYTVDPNAKGTWTAPNLARARELIAASGTEGTKVTVWEFPAFEKVGRYFVSLLNDLRYHARLRVIEDPFEFFGFVLDPRNEVQTAGLTEFGGSQPSANLFLDLVSCHGFTPERPDRNVNAAGFCDPGIDEEIGRAQETQISDPAAAGPLWAEIDHAAVDQAPWVALITPGWVDVVSKRLGNYQANPIWGMLLDQVWVK